MDTGEGMIVGDRQDKHHSKRREERRSRSREKDQCRR